MSDTLPASAVLLDSHLPGLGRRGAGLGGDLLRGVFRFVGAVLARAGMDEEEPPGRLRREPTEIVRRFLRPAPAEITVSPSVVSPRQSIDVKVVAPKPIGNVTSARIELGYDNFYRYRWAGRADAAATATTDAMWLTQDVGTTYGTDRNTKDWVSVATVELPSATSELTDGSATFRIPSWAPPSSS